MTVQMHFTIWLANVVNRVMSSYMYFSVWLQYCQQGHVTTYTLLCMTPVLSTRSCHHIHTSLYDCPVLSTRSCHHIRTSLWLSRCTSLYDWPMLSTGSCHHICTSLYDSSIVNKVMSPHIHCSAWQSTTVNKFILEVTMATFQHGCQAESAPGFCEADNLLTKTCQSCSTTQCNLFHLTFCPEPFPSLWLTPGSDQLSGARRCIDVYVGVLWTDASWTAGCVWNVLFCYRLF